MDAFWDRVGVGHPAGCWEWTGAKSGGYGHFRECGLGTKVAHRISYILLMGSIPEGLVLDHLCQNRPCVNPDHLEPVTPAENTRRGSSPYALAVRHGREPARWPARGCADPVPLHPAEERMVARLRATRSVRGLKRADAAERAGLAEPTLVAIEGAHRHAKVSDVARMADAYGVSLSDLVSDGPYSVPMEGAA